MSEDMGNSCMQETVDAEMERKAKLRYEVIVADKNGTPKNRLSKIGRLSAVSAKDLVCNDFSNIPSCN